MNKAIGIAIATLLLAWAAQGAQVGQWTHDFGATGGSCRAVTAPGNLCFWTGASGNSPLMRVTCPNRTLRITGTLSIKPYVCRDATFANCEQIEATNLRTGSYGDVTLDATDWGVLAIPFGLLIVEYVSGTGEAIVECGG